MTVSRWVRAGVPIVCLVALACGHEEAAEVEVGAESLSRVERIRKWTEILSADSFEGRLTGSRGSAMAADFIAKRLNASGLEPAFEGGYLQPVPLARVREREGGRERIVLLPDESAVDEGTVAERIHDVNVAGILRGEDPERAKEAVIVGAHFDHVGIRPPPPGSPAEAEGDSIYNGADDDASGVVAVLETARSLAAGDPLERTVIFLLTTGEEMGLLGTLWYLEDPAFPLEQTVADLQVEMIGRPDSLAGGVGKAWLTGFERTTLGEKLAAEGVSLVPDPRPRMRFFFRSDNIAFAQRGIPAHTLSSYSLHQDYHTPDDEADRLDYDHMASVIGSLIRAVEIMATGEPPEWKEGGRPGPPPGG